MSKFYYKAKDNSNNLTSGYLTASSISDAAVKLENDGLVVLEINEDVEFTGNVSELENINDVSSDSMFSIKDKIEFFNAFYFMYKSGLSVTQIFSSMFSESKNPNIRGLCVKISRRIERGRTLEDAFQGCSNALGYAYTSLVIAGEHSGKLDEVLLSVLKNLKREEDLKGNLISAFTYPVCILILASFVYMLFNFCLIPIFMSMGQGISMCAIRTIFVMGFAKMFVLYAILFGVIFYVYKNKRILRRFCDFLFALPFISDLAKNYTFANFFSVMGLSYKAGISAYKAVELANSVVTISKIKENISNAVKMIVKGCEITTAFGVSKVFSSFAMSQISAGEKAGELDKMCNVISEHYEKQLETKIAVLLKLLPVILLVCVAITAGSIIIQAYRAFYAGIASF